jgi:hypothetical protein
MESLGGSVVCTMSTYTHGFLRMLGFPGESIARKALEFDLDDYLRRAELCPL